MARQERGESRGIGQGVAAAVGCRRAGQVLGEIQVESAGYVARSVQPTTLSGVRQGETAIENHRVRWRQQFIAAHQHLVCRIHRGAILYRLWVL